MQSPGDGGCGKAAVPVSAGPDEDLYSDLCTWREQLARSIARNNIGMRSSRIGLAVNRAIFSLLTIAIAEDRGLLARGTLYDLAEGGEALLSELVSLFGDPWAGTEGDATGRALETFPATDDAVAGGIVARLAAPDRPYDFAQIPLPSVAAVLDRYLLRTVRRSAVHQAVVVDRPGAGADQPDPSPALFEYTAECTLAAAVDGRCPDDPLPLRVIDPACGAGRMLLLAYRSLIDNPPGRRLTAAERADLLYPTIHGLDLDPHAVAAARMLLALAALDGGGPAASPATFFAAFRGHVMILSGTIRCGNALVGPEIADDESWAFCPVRERHEIRPFAWQEHFPEILVPGGFDAVISCPPETPVPAREWLRQYFQRHYAVYDPEAGLSAYVIEKSLAVLRPCGVAGIITGSRWLHAKSGASLRTLVLGRQIEEIVEAGDGACSLRLMNTPSSHPFVARAAGAAMRGVRDIPGFPVDQQSLSGGGWTLRDTRKDRLLEKISRARTPLGEYVLGYIQDDNGIAPAPGFVIDEHERNELVRADPRCISFLHPYVYGETIERYGIPAPLQYAIFIPQGWTDHHPAAAGHAWRWLKKRHPGIAWHLKEHEVFLKSRSVQGDYWWETVCDPEAWRQEKDRIIFPARIFPPRFTRCSGRAVFDEHTGSIPSGNLYLLGILNSRLAQFVLRSLAKESGTAGDDRPGEILARFPVATPDFDDRNDLARHGRMVSLVTEMLELHRHLGQAVSEKEKRLISLEIASTGKQIDSLVYGIYGLFVDEITVVESFSSTQDCPSSGMWL